MKLPAYELQRSFRRSFSIQINRQGKLIVKAPYFLPESIIRRFLLEKSAWIAKQSSRFPPPRHRPPRKYLEGEEFMYLGKIFTLHIGKFKNISVTDKLNFPDFLVFRIRKELNEWYLGQSKEIITSRTKHYAQVMNTGYTTITFSDTVSKWGSCARNNSLQFNWRLIMAPILVLDYVVVHELAHTIEKNHSRKFWNIVSRYKPAYRQYKIGSR